MQAKSLPESQSGKLTLKLN